MKYKVSKGHALYDQLLELYNNKIECQAAADALAKELGGGEVATTGNHAAGGIDGIKFDEKPEGWKAVGSTWQHLFYPKASMKALHNRIAALPVVTHEEQNRIIGFSHGSYAGGGGFVWVNTYGIGKAEGCFIISTPDDKAFKYKPVDGMVEITVSEFNELQETIK